VKNQVEQVSPIWGELPPVVRKGLRTNLEAACRSIRRISSTFIETARLRTDGSVGRHFEERFGQAVGQFGQTLEKALRDDGEICLAWIGSDVPPDRVQFVETQIANHGMKLINAARRRAAPMLRGACERMVFRKTRDVSRRSIRWVVQKMSIADMVDQLDHPVAERALVVAMQLEIGKAMRVVLERESGVIVHKLAVMAASCTTPAAPANVAAIAPRSSLRAQITNLKNGAGSTPAALSQAEGESATKLARPPTARDVVDDKVTSEDSFEVLQADYRCVKVEGEEIRLSVKQAAVAMKVHKEQERAHTTAALNKVAQRDRDAKLSDLIGNTPLWKKRYIVSVGKGRYKWNRERLKPP